MDVQRAFVADAAHELRTPLTALKLQIQLAERATSEAERKTAFAELSHGFERATHLVQQLLTLARQEPGTAQKVRQPVDLVALARNVVADLAPTANARNIDLGIQAETPAIIHGDGDALRVLLGNLVDNAIRYTPDGGTVDVSIHADGETTSISVEDSGPGIPDSDLERVFDRFYRVPGVRVEGSGLGLAIVRQIADANDAQVSLRNTGHGLLACVSFQGRHPGEV
jgi:two-component system OmpR family sensor kinase